jgi:uncharacterized protein
MIIEGLITTMSAAGEVNLAPMGVEWGEERIVLKPFLETTTFRNLRHGGAAVFHLVDDVELLAEAAIASPQAAWTPARAVRGAVLQAACSWRELEVESVDATPPRSRIVTRVVHAGMQREFLGLNRARHAVLEAAILATRLHLIPAAEVDAELTRLGPLVEKTAGPRERTAWARVTAWIAAKRTGVP